MTLLKVNYIDCYDTLQYIITTPDELDDTIMRIESEANQTVLDYERFKEEG